MSLPEYLIPPLVLAAIVLGFVLWIRSLRPRVARSVEALAAALSLGECASPDPRMRIFAGRVMDLSVEVASHASYTAIYGEAPFAHAHDPSLTLRVKLERPLQSAFVLDTSRGATEDWEARAVGLDPIFKVSAASREALGRLLGSGPVRDAINALPGTGRIVCVDNYGVRVYYAEPRPETAAQLGAAAVRAAQLLAQREAFLS